MEHLLEIKQLSRVAHWALRLLVVRWRWVVPLPPRCRGLSFHRSFTTRN